MVMQLDIQIEGWATTPAPERDTKPLPTPLGTQQHTNAIN